MKIDFAASFGILSGLEYVKVIPELNITEKLDVVVGDQLNLKEKLQLVLIFYQDLKMLNIILL